MKSRKLMAILLSATMVLTMTPALAFADDTGAGASGQTFVDMPSDWSTDALKSAAANGLINGYDGKTGKEIRATGNLSRAEMATMVNRAFGASTKASLSGVNDVASSAWYADDMAKAVQMGTFKADAAMRPDAKITRQEAFTVLARAFKVTDADSSKGLASFSDGANVATWAKDGVCGLVDKGYVAGANGALNPTANITRAEFAKIMDNMVKQYMKEANTYTTAASGNVMVNVPGAVLKDMTINGDLIIGDGVGTGNITLDGVKVTGRTVVRGGGVNSVIITGSSDLGSIIIAKVDGNVRVSVEGAAKVSTIIVNDGKDDVVLEGKIGSVEVAAATPVVVQKAEIGSISVTAAKADLTVAKDATVTTVTIAKDADGSKVAVAGTVTTLKTEAPKADLSVTGTVKTVEVASSATDTKVAVAKDAKVDSLKNDAKGTTTSGEGKPGSTTGSEGVTNDKGETTKPSTGGGGGSGSGGSSTIAVGTLTYNENSIKINDVQYIMKDGDAFVLDPAWDVNTKIEVAGSGSGFTPSQSYPMYVDVSITNRPMISFTQPVMGNELNKPRLIIGNKDDNNVTDGDVTSDNLDKLLDPIWKLWTTAGKEAGDTVTVAIGTTVNGSKKELMKLSFIVGS